MVKCGVFFDVRNEFLNIRGASASNGWSLSASVYAVLSCTANSAVYLQEAYKDLFPFSQNLY
jgi:hypothetical protein